MEALLGPGQATGEGKEGRRLALCRRYLVLQEGAVGVDVAVLLRETPLEGLVHVGVGGGKPLELQPTEESLSSEHQDSSAVLQAPPLLT